MRPSSLLAAVALPVVAACQPPAPDTVEQEYVTVRMNEPTTLELPGGQASMWADAESAPGVRCWATPPGSSTRTQLRSHMSEHNVIAPVTRDGEEYYIVGKLPEREGQVTVECTGPDTARLYAAMPAVED